MQDPLICYYNDPPATTYSFGRDDDPMWIESQPALRSCYSPDGGEEAPLSPVYRPVSSLWAGNGVQALRMQWGTR
jgi:hypothetical protein